MPSTKPICWPSSNAYAAGYDPQALLDRLEKLHAIEEHKKSEMAKIPGYHLSTKLPLPLEDCENPGQLPAGTRSDWSYPIRDG